MALCPFPDHKEKTPSFSISPEKQLYHCFGCGKSGNAYRFLMDFHGYLFPEAVRWCANKSGIEVPEDETFVSKSYQQKQNKKKKLFSVQKKSSLFMEQFLETQIDKNLDLKKYIESRQFSAEVLKTFHVGHLPDKWDSLVNWAHQNKIPLDQLIDLGLVKESSKHKGRFFDVLRNRLIFPIHDISGEVIGFGGRKLKPEQEPKYLNSPETLLFSKRKNLFGLYQAAPYMRSRRSVLLVEGYTDVISLYQNGIKNVLGVLGTAVTEDHGKLLKRFVDKILVLFDGDTAGLRASIKSLEALLPFGFNLQGILLPEGEDPDSLCLKLGAKDFSAYLKDNQKDLLSLLMGHDLISFKGEPQEKSNLGEKWLNWVSLIPSKSVRELYFDQISHMLRVEKPWVKQLFHDVLQKKKELSLKTANYKNKEAQKGQSAKPDAKTRLAKNQQVEKLSAGNPLGEKASDGEEKTLSEDHKFKLPEKLKLIERNLLFFALLDPVAFMEETKSRDWNKEQMAPQLGHFFDSLVKIPTIHKKAQFLSRLHGRFEPTYYLDQVMRKPWSDLTDEEIIEGVHGCLSQLDQKKKKEALSLIKQKLGHGEAGLDKVVQIIQGKES